MPYSEADMREACEAYRKEGSLRKQGLEFDVSYSTLRRRLIGVLPHAVAHQHQQKLSVVLEKSLADWVIFQADLGLPLTHTQIRGLAQRICVDHGEPQEFGKRWMAAFLRRYPVLKTQRPQRIDSARVKLATEERIRPWFNYLAIPAVKAIPPQHRYNVDEAGIMEGVGDNGLVVGRAETKVILAKQPGSRNWTSFMETISATGVALTPVVI